jgi:hypothetical protein
MNRIILQIWEQSNLKEGFLSDGCSLHISQSERDRYVSEVYKGRDKSNIPSEYDRVVGDGVVAFVNDEIYNIIESDLSVKLKEPALQNLLKFNDIILNTIEI